MSENATLSDLGVLFIILFITFATTIIAETIWIVNFEKRIKKLEDEKGESE